MFSSQIYCVTFVNHRCTGGFTYFTLHFIHATFCIEPRNIAPCDVTFSHYIGDRITCRSKSKTAPAYIRIRAYGLNNTNKAICNFVDKEGRGYGAAFNLKADASDILIPVSDLVPTKAAMLPQDWPGVNPYWYPASAQENNGIALDWKIIDFVQVSLREELYNIGNQKNKGVVVERIDLLFQ